MKISDRYQEIMHSDFKEELCGMIKQKQALGFKYESQIQMLVGFDRYICDQFGNTLELTKEIAESWVEAGSTTEKKRRRALLIHQFGEYLHQIGRPAYLYPKRKYRAPSKYIPYIFTKEQINTIFQFADNAVSITASNKRKGSCEATAMILKMLYGCGLRISEALQLRIKDIDLDTGVLKIWDSKYHKDRLVPMSTSLHQSIANYVSKSYDDNAYLFSDSGIIPYNRATIYSRFRDIIFNCNIPHRGKGHGPRLHDFRHTFAVHSLKQLADSGEDIYTVLPVLSKYMGHSSVSATQYYLRLTSEMYPDVIKQVDNYFGDVYPEVFTDD